MSEDDVPEVTDSNEVLVDATPWYNSDTVAASMLFAANLAQAAAAHFQNIAMLAMGQSAHEWVVNDRNEFADEVVNDLNKLPEGGGVDG